MVLNGRLKLIYDMIPQCRILSDIGTDHAYIPAYALLNNKCQKALACDLRQGPIERARRTRKKYNLENKMELRLGSGLEPIEEHEADVIIMAGMGSFLIEELIEQSIKKTQSANYLLLQPMTGQEKIRPFLWNKGFEVVDEGLINEGKRIYQVILVRYKGKKRDCWDRIDEFIGEKLIDKNDTLLLDWVKEQIRKQKKTVSGLNKAKIVIHKNIEQEERLLKEFLILFNSLGGKTGES